MCQLVAHIVEEKDPNQLGTIERFRFSFRRDEVQAIHYICRSDVQRIHGSQAVLCCLFRRQLENERQLVRAVKQRRGEKSRIESNLLFLLMKSCLVQELKFQELTGREAAVRVANNSLRSTP
jgi:hypothetical protein